MSEEKAEYMNSPVDELKPCPFCGSKDIDERGWLSGDGGAGPQCMNCGATAEPQWWNTRAESPDSATAPKWTPGWRRRVERWLTTIANARKPSWPKGTNESLKMVERQIRQYLEHGISKMESAAPPPESPDSGGWSYREGVPGRDWGAFVVTYNGESMAETLSEDRAKKICRALSPPPPVAAEGGLIRDCLAALQHQDGVVISRECAECAMNSFNRDAIELFDDLACMGQEGATEEAANAVLNQATRLNDYANEIEKALGERNNGP